MSSDNVSVSLPISLSDKWYILVDESPIQGEFTFIAHGTDSTGAEGPFWDMRFVGPTPPRPDMPIVGIIYNGPSVEGLNTWTDMQYDALSKLNLE